LNPEKSIEQYRDIIGYSAVNEIKDLANRLRGASVTHINSTKFGGGVAEILQNLIPLAQSLSFKVNWDVIQGAPEFFDVTKSFHNALQGMNCSLTQDMKTIYLKYNKKFADKLHLDSDVIFIHDPQPAPLINFLNREQKKFVWRCHIDLTDSNTIFWRFLRQFVKQYDALIFSLDKYVKEDIRKKNIFIVPPSIDPLSDKNKFLSPNEVNTTLRKFDIDPDRAIITQVSRFDFWKDPFGVIECYKLVKRKIPETQLLLIGSLPIDDPESEIWLKKLLSKSEKLHDVHILTNLDGVEDFEVNAFQRASTVILQKSLREGFALTVAEALWKGTPVVATRVGGIPLQVIDGVTGYLINSIEEAAEKVIHLLKRRYLAKMLGLEGKEHIQRNFLITRHLRDYIKIHLEIIESETLPENVNSSNKCMDNSSQEN
jgi:trehalose synthase